MTQPFSMRFGSTKRPDLTRRDLAKRGPTRPPGSTAWGALLVGACLIAAGVGLAGCDKDKQAKPPVEAKRRELPTLRIYAVSGAAGAIEPCGCVKDMLGGIDHAAAYLASQKEKAPSSLVVGAGPMFFEDPSRKDEESAQVAFKAETMAESLGDLGMLAWAPGANDWASGVGTLEDLVQKAQAQPLAANLTKKAGPVARSRLIERGGIKVGLVGVSVPERLATDVTFPVADASSALVEAAREVETQGAQVTIALIAAQRGAALRMIEAAQGQANIQVAVLGKAFDQGEGNDPPIAPDVVGKTLAVQTPNHLQRIAVIDLFVRDGSFEFADGAGLGRNAKKKLLSGRIQELSSRLEKWRRPESGVSPQDLAAQEAKHKELERELAALDGVAPTPSGSYFSYQLVDIVEKLGENPKVSARMSSYYKRVNEHNKEAFADRLPPPLAEGESGYVGVDACSECHAEERAFWDTTGHSGAYATLSDQHKEFNLDCVSCHVTGYEKPGGSTVTHVEKLENVGCEVCHGPGSRHVEAPINPDFIRSQPSAQLCADSCHHPPHVGEDWDVAEAWQKIVGPGHGRPANPKQP